MEKIVIMGGERLTGEVKISGAKNAALSILAASILAQEEVILKNAPRVRDITTMLELLKTFGADVLFEDGKILIDPKGITKFEAPYDLVRQMRASILALGSLLARFGRVRISLPGGCAIGSRPIDLHLKALERLGARTRIEGGYVEIWANKLVGNKVSLDFPSVGATSNLIMAASLAEGKTHLEGAAKEPEIQDLIAFLNTIGARIEGGGREDIEITGVKELKGGTYEVMPDRIEAGTYMVAGAITEGDILVKGAEPSHLGAVVTKLQESGTEVEEVQDGIRVTSCSRHPIEIKTMPYPGFPTDMQAQFMALTSITPGMSLITETIFENRFMHVDELKRMGADIRIEGHTAVVNGVPKLSGAPVMATDLRASASLILAGLAAEGRTEVLRIYHLDRGYERIEEKLSNLGARIWREEDV